MAWLKGLAGKAENFLNQIDQNAAVAFQGDKKGPVSKEVLLTEVTWDNRSQERDILIPSTSSWTPGNTTGMPTVRSSPNLSALSPARTPTIKPHNDEDLINFLNSSEPAENSDVQNQPATSVVNHSASVEAESYQFTPVKFETLHEKAPTPNLLPSDSSRSSSRRSSPHDTLQDNKSQRQSPMVMSTNNVINLENGASSATFTNHISDINKENELLRNELRTLNNEMSQLLHRAKTAEKECANQQKLLVQLQDRADQVNHLEQELLILQQQAISSQESIRALEIENVKLVQASEDKAGNENVTLQCLKEEIESLKSRHTQEMTTLESRFVGTEQECLNLRTELSEMEQQLSHKDNVVSSLQQQMERARDEAKQAREELDQYRLRAQRILQDKEKLISELRGEGSTLDGGQDDSVVLELQQLRQERELLREETAQITTRLQAARDELLEAEKRLELCREQATEAQNRLQESLNEERKKRQTAEEDCKIHADELRSVRDELSRQRSLLASRVREREAELTRLRTQLSQRPTSPTDDELESRLHTLTQTLVQKQSTLETVTTEKNALRLQLEKMERKHQEMLALLHQNQSGIINVNDTDDAKAQIPSFFVETPFDTGMTRRVKRAYSSLDAVSIRTGVFLRRYPLARILVLCYMVLLHLWVMLVLFTYTPQAQ